MKISTGLLFVSGAALLSMTGCVDQEKSLFDAAAVAAEYESAFPVSDIDPNMDWKTTNSVSLTVAVEEDAGVDYTVRVFTENPLVENSSAKLLAEGVVRKGQPMTRTIDVPKTLDGVYVTRTDAHNRHLMVYSYVQNNAVSVGFGTSLNTATTRAGEFSYRTSTRADETVTVPTYAPIKSESEVNALLAGATEFTLGTSVWGDNPLIWKVSKGNTVNLTYGSIYGSTEGCSLLVAGTLEIDVDGFKPGGYADIYVLNGGVLKVKNFQLDGSTTLTVFKGGTVISDGTLNFAACGDWNTTNRYFYNNGTINVKNLTGGDSHFYNDVDGVVTVSDALTVNTYYDVINRGTISAGYVSSKIQMVYNVGTITATDFETNLYNIGDATFASCATNYNKNVTNNKNLNVDGSFHGNLVNNGTAVIGDYYMEDNNTLVNNCHLTCKGDFRGDITTTENTRTDILGDLYAGYKRVLAKNSMIYVAGKADLHSALFYGPTAAGEYAIFKANEISDFQINSTDKSTPCHVYIESNGYPYSTATEKGIADEALAWLSAVGGAYASYGNSNLVIPEGDCTGSGNTPTDKGDKDISTYDELNYTYVFEDNFPNAGDYDFNDAVIDVQKVPNYDSNGNLTSTDLNITLRAVGAIQNIGSAIRLVGFRKTDISSVTFTDTEGVRNTLTDSESQFANVDMEDEDTPVIPLFGNAHAALGVGHVLVNTGISGNEVSSKSFTVSIASSKEITADNLDLFITNGKNVSGKRVEVHLYQFRDNGATALGDVCEDNLDVAANRTWALQVPDFKYPQESVPIKNAYPNFVSWAKNRVEGSKVNEDWYLYPTTNTDKVYIYQK